MRRPGYLRNFSGMQSRTGFGHPPHPHPHGGGGGGGGGGWYPPVYGYPNLPLDPVILPEFPSSGARAAAANDQLVQELAETKLALLKAQLEKEQTKKGFLARIFT